MYCSGGTAAGRIRDLVLAAFVGLAIAATVYDVGEWLSIW
jgi:hypothetical protein